MSIHSDNEKKATQNELYERPTTEYITVDFNDETANRQLAAEECTQVGEKEKESVVDIKTEMLDEAFAGVQRKYWAFGITAHQELLPPPPGAPPMERRGIITYQPGRNSFVKHVFLLVLCMLTCSIICTLVVCYSEEVKSLLKSRIGFLLLMFTLPSLLAIMYSFSFEYAKRSPCSYMLLAFTTMSVSFTCAYMTAAYAPHVVLAALFTDSAICVLCLALSYTNIDFTKCLLLVIVACFSFLSAILIASIATMLSGMYFTITNIIVIVVGSMIVSLMLIMEFQMILGGRMVEISEDDYVLAAFLVYISIIDLFLKCLGINGCHSMS